MKNRYGISFYLVAATLSFLGFGGCSYLNKTVIPPNFSGQNLDSWLESHEASIPGIIPGTEKTIRWAGNPNEKTPLAYARSR